MFSTCWGTSKDTRELIQLPKQCLEPVVEIQLTDEECPWSLMEPPCNLSMISHYYQGRSSQ